MASLSSSARTDADGVRDIIDTSLEDTHLNAFINTANTIVSDRLTGKGLSSALLTEIEKYLAAHLLSTRDQRVQEERVADWDATFQGKTGMGLKATYYGQQVLLLDTSGTLAQEGLKRAEFEIYSEYDYTWLDNFGDT